jgi:hypothetical protein
VADCLAYELPDELHATGIRSLEPCERENIARLVVSLIEAG